VASHRRQKKLFKLTGEDETKMLRSKVAVLRTHPDTIFDDISRAMRMADYMEALPKDKDTALKINISWGKFYPACSTTPWQLEGVIRTLLEDGYQRDLIHACQNRTVVVSAKTGEHKNRQKVVVDSYRIRNIHLYKKQEKWIRYEPKGKTKVLHEVYPKGIHIPQRLIGENIIHLPTAKTHVFTSMTGAMKNAFGGLLNEKRHWTHSVIDETLADLLMIQKEIHTGIFAIMDGTVAGSGPGPRCMNWHLKNIILASADQVAIDAVAAKIMGFDPMSLGFIRRAHERGLGLGRLNEIEVVGEDISEMNWHFRSGDTLASHGQHAIYHGIFKPLERLFLRTPLVLWAYLASWAYHDGYWYPFIGRKRVAEFMRTPWGEMFQRYAENGDLPLGVASIDRT
jgi:uncharacterized protein (DUF362 family)